MNKKLIILVIALIIVVVTGISIYTLSKDDDNTTTANQQSDNTSVENNESDLGLVQVYNPKDKQNLISYLVGVNQNGNNKLTLYINPEMFNTLTLENRIVILKHEALHIIHNHFLRATPEHKSNHEVWNIAIKEKIDVNEMILKVDYRVWRRALERMEQWATWKDWEAWNDRILAWKRNENIHYNLFDIKYRENGLIEEIMEWVGLSKLEEDIWTYTEKLIDFYKSYYKEEVLLENSVGLPDELQLALELKKQKEYCESGQDRKALEHLKNCLGIYPKLEKVMLTYAEMVRNKMQQQITEAKEAQEELQQMVISLKNIAKQKLESGETAAAKAILSQVQQYAPDDDEIKTLLHNLEEEVQ